MPRNILAEVLKRLVPPPPLTVDPLHASPAELVRAGYPRRPPRANVEAFRMWKALVTGTPVTVARSLRGGGLDFANYRLSFAPENFPGRQETSLNWSGAVTRSIRQIQTIYGEFEMPPFSAPVGVRRGEYRCSSWIGIDGHDPTSQSMPQIGVTMKVDVGPGGAPPSYEPWFQWWSRRFHLPPITIPNLPIRAGDTIVCAVEIVNGSTVNLCLQNRTAPNAPTFAMQVDAQVLYGLIYIDPVTGTTGEWIAERPTRLDSDVRYPLPAFGAVKFDVAMVAGSTGSQRDPGPMRMIRMVEGGARAGSRPGNVAVLSRATRARHRNGSTTVTAGPYLVEHLTG